VSKSVASTAAEAGLRVTKDAKNEAYRPTALYGRPVSERSMNMHARLHRILEGAGGRSTPSEALANATHPKLAKEFVALWFFFMTRHSAPPVTGIDPNPFRNLSELDAGAKLHRLLENICDRSTGKMGPWTNGISVSGAARNRG
jgi:hypothetical protein